VAVSPELEFLVASTRRAIAVLRAELLARPVGGVGTDALADHTSHALDAVDADITAYESQFAGATTPHAQTAIAQNLRLLNTYVQVIHESTPWLKSRVDPHLHLGMRYLVDEAAAEIVGDDLGIVTVADPVYMYSTLTWPFRAVIDALGGQATGPTPIVLFYPVQEATATLLHPIFIHELGHTAIDRHDLVERVLQNHGDQASFNADYQAAVNEAAKSAGVTAKEAAPAIDEALSFWLGEIICDAIAVRYLGPTYFLAFAAFVLPMSKNEPSDDHPPTTLRLALMYAALDAANWLPILDTRIPATTAWLWDMAVTPPEMAPAPVVFLRDAVTRLWPQALIEADDLLTTTWEPQAFTKVSGAIQEQMNHQILPAQLVDGTPLDRRALLLEGWLRGIEGRGDDPRALADLFEDVAAQQFLAKALEMSAVAEQWIKS
jgi:hypothetical protein